MLAAAGAGAEVIIGAGAVHLTGSSAERVTTIGSRHVEVSTPVAVDRGARLPLSTLAAPTHVVDARTEAGAALRAFLAHPAVTDLTNFTPEDWALLSQSKDRLIFGQRTGTVGVGAVLSLQRSGSDWTFETSGGCGPLIWPRSSSRPTSKPRSSATTPASVSASPTTPPSPASSPWVRAPSSMPASSHPGRWTRQPIADAWLGRVAPAPCEAAVRRDTRRRVSRHTCAYLAWSPRR